MIYTSGKIQILSGGTLDSASGYPGNNISSDISSVLNKKFSNKDYYLLNAYDGQEQYVQGVYASKGKINYYISSTASGITQNANGRYDYLDSDLSFIFNSSDGIDFFYIEFDKLNNLYPYTIEISSITDEVEQVIKTIYNLSSICAIDLENTYTAIKVRFIDTEVANSPLIITGVYSKLEIDINNNSLMNFNIDYSDREDNEFPSWGVVSQSGNLTLRDDNGLILEYIEQGLIIDGLLCEIKLHNSLNGKASNLCVMYTKDWEYNNENKECSVSLYDKLLALQDMNIESNFYDINNYNTVNGIVVSELYNYIRQNSNGVLPNTTIFSNVYIPEFAIFPNTNTVWGALQELCEVTQAFVYQNKDGVIKIVRGI